MEQTVCIRLPKEQSGEENFELVSVNGKRYKIMKGVDVDVPAEVYGVLRCSEEARAEAERVLLLTAEG